MKTHHAILILLAALLAAPARGDDPPAKKKDPHAGIAWKKTVIDKAFRSEGVAVVDVNKDGKPDIVVGDVWYEAPDWKMHVIRKDRKFNPANYSESFACFAGDFNGDGWPDVIVIPFPGNPCYWYENPRNQPGPWKAHLVTHSACNETPIYVDLFGKGKRVLVMGVQPKGKDGKAPEDRGQMFWLAPGKDPYAPWEHHPISEPSKAGKETPSTRRFSHGLGHGDVNGDGRIDIICPAGWWEQPEKISDEPWKFHPANLGPDCSDMFAYDIDGDGKNDIVSSSAHGYGLWWHQQNRNKDGVLEFIRRDLFAPPTAKVELPKDLELNTQEEAILTGINKMRAEVQLPPLALDRTLYEAARREASVAADDPECKGVSGKPGLSPWHRVRGRHDSPEACLKQLRESFSKSPLRRDGGIVGIGCVRVGKGKEHQYVVIVAAHLPFYLFSESHALHVVDINGDGLKDLVTGRRYWAHGPKGDPGAGGPPVLYWFQAKRDKKGFVTFTPHLIDDDSGIGTQFAVADINGDGLLDIIISNKRGVFIFEQVRVEPLPPRKE